MSNCKELETLMSKIIKNNPNAAAYMENLYKENHEEWEKEMDKELKKEMNRELEEEMDEELEKETNRELKKETNRELDRQMLMSKIIKHNPNAAAYMENLYKENHEEWEKEMDRELKREMDRELKKVIDQELKREMDREFMSSIISYQNNINNLTVFDENLEPNENTIDIICPLLGIGDILIEKMKFFSHNLYLKKFRILSFIPSTFRESNKTKYLNFIIQLINLLFKNTVIEINTQDNISKCFKLPLIDYPFKNTYLYDLVKDKMDKITVGYSNYITINTKARLYPLKEFFLKNDLYLLNNFFKNFKTNKNIILIGEKKLEESIENFASTCIYNNLLFLNNNNNVIDLTYETGYFQEDFDKFLFDIELINKADCNINLGLGGSLQMIQAFSKHNICYISNLSAALKDISGGISEILENYQLVNSNMYSCIHSFLNKIDHEYSIAPGHYIINNQSAYITD